MLTIQIIFPDHSTKTMVIENAPMNDTLIYRPCLYCAELVRDPRKTCSESHRVMYCKKSKINTCR